MPIPAITDGWPADLQPLADVALRKMRDPVIKMVEEDGRISIDHRPRIGKNAFAIVLFSGLPANQLHAYMEAHKIIIPAFYQGILRVLSGAFAFQMSLYGISKSMLQNPPLLDRRTLQPRDLATANKSWKREYKGQANAFHFGGASFSRDENVGYFFDQGVGYFTARRSGNIVQRWDTLSALIRDEIERSESIYPQYEDFMWSLHK